MNCWKVTLNNMDWYDAEGWDMAIFHFKENGFFHWEDNWNDFIFAYHSKQSWNQVKEIIYKQWGRYVVWTEPELITTSLMKNGKINYIFRLVWK